MARRYDFDWLRIGAVLLLFPYHTARIFDSVPHYYIKSNRSVLAFDLFARFMEQWHMPLFFMLAGAASCYSLRRRSVRTFLSERLQRLFVPLLVGLLIILPPMGYWAVRSRNADISFWAYYPTFFQIDLAHLDGFLGTFTPAHLWFILFLLLFSFVSLRNKGSVERGQSGKVVARLGARLSKRPYLIWLAALPLYLARMTGFPYPNPLFF